MRRLAVVFILLAVPVFAQRGGARAGGMHSGGGVRAGGGMRGGTIARFHGGTGGFHGGAPRGPAFRSNFGFRRFGYYPYLYSGWYGFGWYDPFFYESPDAYYYGPGAYGYGYAGSNSGGPPVVIVQNMAPAPEPPPSPPGPEVREYISPPPPPPSAGSPQYSGPSLYLVAFQDGVIRAVLTYWVEDRTLHYIDPDHKEKQAPLSSVDRSLSDRLNRERNVPFHLPN